MIVRIFILWSVCLAVSANSIVGGGDFLYNYNLSNGVKIDQTAWGYILFPQRLTRAESFRYIMISTRSEVSRPNAFTFRFNRRIYPVDPLTAALDPARLYDYGQLNFTLTTHRPERTSPGVIRMAMMRGKVQATVADRGQAPRNDPGTVYFSNLNLNPCSNLFKVNEEKIVLYPRDNVVMFERHGHKMIRTLDGAADYRYYGFAEQPAANGFLVNEFTDIVMWDRLDPLPTRLGNTYYRHVYTGYRNDGKYTVPEMAYWRGRSLYDGGFDVERDFPAAIKEFERAAELKHVFGLYYLGLCHLFGTGTPENRDKGGEYIRQAAAYQYDKAMALYGLMTGDRKMLEAAANQGNAEALYLTGEWEKAAARGHAKAVYKLGMNALEQGDIVKAREFFTKTVELRFAPGINKLGELTAAPVPAFALFEQAARLGDPDALFNAGWHIFRHKQDNAAAFDYFTSGSILENLKCRIALALADKVAEPGVRQFLGGAYDAALKHWQDKPSPYGDFAAGLCYIYGYEAEKDLPRGFELMKRSAEQGVVEAWAELGRCYEFGIGCPDDEKKAMECYVRSTMPQANLALVRLYRKHQINLMDVSKLLKQAAEAGYLEGMRQYAEHLASNPPKRTTEASLWWGRYLDARLRQDNNSVNAPYWLDLPCCLPVEVKNDMPIDYESDLKDPTEIRAFYQKYGH